MAQNIQNTILAIFGLFLCVAAWFFAGYAVNYAYSSPPTQAERPSPSQDPYSFKIETYPDNWEPRTLQCVKHDHIPDFTLGFYSNPSENELEELCSCIDQNLQMPWARETGEKIQKRRRGDELDT